MVFFQPEGGGFDCRVSDGRPTRASLPLIRRAPLEPLILDRVKLGMRLILSDTPLALGMHESDVRRTP